VAHTDELLTVEEAASHLGLSTSRLYQLRGAGEGPISWRSGSRLVYPRSGLDAYRAEQRQRTMRGRGVVTA
jgi:predicted DNA-binding transcriptional regulator AlpA